MSMVVVAGIEPTWDTLWRWRIAIMLYYHCWAGLEPASAYAYRVCFNSAFPLTGQKIGAGNGNRTRNLTLAKSCVTTSTMPACMEASSAWLPKVFGTPLIGGERVVSIAYRLITDTSVFKTVTEAALHHSPYWYPVLDSNQHQSSCKDGG